MSTRHFLSTSAALIRYPEELKEVSGRRSQQNTPSSPNSVIVVVFAPVFFPKTNTVSQECDLHRLVVRAEVFQMGPFARSPGNARPGGQRLRTPRRLHSICLLSTEGRTGEREHLLSSLAIGRQTAILTKTMGGMEPTSCRCEEIRDAPGTTEGKRRTA